MDTRRSAFSCRIMASEEIEVISVTDVYDQAAGIAHEFDRIIHNYGSDSVTELMPRVIRSLEQLESLASRYERDGEEINQLRYKVEKLESEKAERAQERTKFGQELESIEENWQSEVKELLSVVNKLQEENRRLRENARNEKYSAVADLVAKRQETEEEEFKALAKLKETVDKLKEELRCMKRELKQKGVDCDALQEQLQRISKINTDLRLKNSTHKKQARFLLQEKLDLETQLQEKDEEVDHIKKLISEKEKFDEHRAAVKAVIAATRGSEEDDGSEHKDADDEPINQQLAKARVTSTTTETDDMLGSSNPLSEGNQESKLVIEYRGPAPPEYTIEELRQVLMERNDLKTRLFEVEEELAQYKPNDDLNAKVDEKVEKSEKKSSYRGEEVMVYGPINREPDEKTGRKKESGIRKLFLYILEAGIDMLVGSDVEEEEEEDEIPELPVYSVSPNTKSKPNGMMETKL